MGQYRDLESVVAEGIGATGGTYRKLDKPDPRASKDYAVEKAKATARDKFREDRESAFDALTNTPPLPVLDEMRGATFAAGNEAMNLGRRLLGRPTVDSRAIYLANKDAENESEARERAKHPIATGVGGILTGLAAKPAQAAAMAPQALPVAKSLFDKAASFALNSGKAGLGGGIFASLYGAADGEGAGRLKGAIDNFVPGVEAGIVTHGAASALKPIVATARKAGADVLHAMTSRPPAPGVPAAASPRQVEIAEAAVDRLAARRGLTPQEVSRIASEDFQGKPATAAEILGREGVTQLAATARRGGSTADSLEATLALRQREAPHRILSDFEQHLGVSPEAAQGDIEAIVAKGRKTAGPLYDEAYAAGGIDTPQLQALVNRPSMRNAMARAVRIAAEEGRDPAELGFRMVHRGAGTTGREAAVTAPQLVDGRFQVTGSQHVEDPQIADVHVQVEKPTAQTWDYVKRGLDDVLNSKRDQFGRLNLDEEGRAILGTLNAFRGELTGANPAYGRALEHSGDYLSIETALKRGKGVLTRGTVRDFGKVWASAKGPAEQDALRAAIASDVLDLANAGHLKGGKFSIPGIQQKLELAFGRPGAERFLAAMEAEAQLARTGQRMMPGNGSPTYELAEAGGNGDGGMLGEAAKFVSKAAKGPHGILEGVAGAAQKALAYPRTAGMAPEVRNEYGRLLQMSPDELIDYLTRRQPKPVPQPRGQWLVPAVAGGQVAQGMNK